ncbi:hypothetical protein SARC_11661 [Sphaeroforma arctica JP610]|uniref:Uncharacterized protein n=1 Tax=Sphaeroforma arctica JP610 TaxID=667725 RepID=A0A0L0FIF3_9EUKA|nr:hypothetical protein SARC_11661 [Sphaeroforma arctica JP610]KNC75818.1 hypothetical protein SARC_11661 [Sphaeroforma arctica JP610]|eukprot:XP_014149720.1 hypothetical protein SARC_11661 [Sphaeroforma arctica JP610]
MDVESNSASSGNESDYSSDEVFVDARMSVDDTDTSDSVFNKPESSSQLEVRIGPQDGRQQSINQGINQGREQSPRGEPSTQQTHRNTPDTSSVIHPIKLGRQVNIPLHSSTNTPEEFYSKGKRARMSDAEASTGQAHAIESDTHINADILHDNTSDKGMQETKSQDTNTNGNTNISAGTTTDATPSVEVSDANVNENGNANANVPMSTSGDVEVQTSEKAGKSTSTTTPEYFNVIGSGTNTAGTDTAAANSATTAKESKLAYAGQIAGTIASHGYTTLSMASSAAGRLYSYATTPSPTQPINTGLNEEQDLQLQKILDGWDAVDGDKVHEEIKDRLVVAVMGRVSAGRCITCVVYRLC